MSVGLRRILLSGYRHIYCWYFHNYYNELATFILARVELITKHLVN